jgi:hypothetical protein
MLRFGVISGVVIAASLAACGSDDEQSPRSGARDGSGGTSGNASGGTGGSSNAGSGGGGGASGSAGTAGADGNGASSGTGGSGGDGEDGSVGSGGVSGSGVGGVGGTGGIGGKDDTGGTGGTATGGSGGTDGSGGSLGTSGAGGSGGSGGTGGTGSNCVYPQNLDFSEGIHCWLMTGDAARFTLARDARIDDRWVLGTYVPDLLEAAQGELWQNFVVPANATSLRFKVAGGTSKVQLFVFGGSPSQHKTVSGAMTNATYTDVNWDLVPLRNRSVSLRIIDAEVGAWGFVFVTGFELLT